MQHHCKPYTQAFSYFPRLKMGDLQSPIPLPTASEMPILKTAYRANLSDSKRQVLLV